MRVSKIIFLFITIIGFGCYHNQSLDKLYFNGIIWTGDKNNPSASAILIKDNLIVFVGSNEDALSRSNRNTIKIDLKERFVTPGFIDNHVHFINGGLQLSQVDLHDVKDKAEFQRRIKIIDKQLPPGKWMLGGNWDHEKWGGNYPNRSWIDDVVSDRPVLLDRLDGHMALANSKALMLAKITKNKIGPIGGIIERDRMGIPTGILKDRAIDLCSQVIPDWTVEELDQALDKAMDYAISLGITQVHDMGSFDDLSVYQRSYSNGNLNIRIKLYTWYTHWREIINHVHKNGPGNNWLRWDGIKGMMDGSLGSKTAWMKKPYLEDITSVEKEHFPTVGIITLEDTTDFKRILRETDKANIQHAVHAIGDMANDWILDEFEKIRLELGAKDRRNRIEHAQHLSKSAVQRFSAENIIPSMQPYHLFDDGCWAHKRIDYDLLSRTYIFRTLIESGANLTFGSDWTVASLNPLTGIYAAVTRRTRDGNYPDGWFPEEKISVEDALRAYTVNNSYAAFWETKTGSISPGKFADFVIHSKNLLTIVPDTLLKSRVLRTVIGGKDYIFE